MIEIVALTVSLHYVCAFFIVDVFDLFAGVWADALAVKPRSVIVANSVGWKSAKVGHGHCLGCYTRTVAEDAAAGWIGEHGIAKAIDEVRCCGCLAEGCYEVCGQGQ